MEKMNKIHFHLTKMIPGDEKINIESKILNTKGFVYRLNSYEDNFVKNYDEVFEYSLKYLNYFKICLRKGLNIIYSKIKESKHRETNVFIEGCNLHPEIENIFRNLIIEIFDAEFDYDVSIYVSEIFNLDELLKIEKKLEEDLKDEKLLQKFKYIFEYFWKHTVTELTQTKVHSEHLEKKAIICDIDGTIAICHDRNVFDIEKCLSDITVNPIIRLLQIYSLRDYKILFVTGRDEKFRKITEEFILRKVYLSKDVYELYMRPTNDQRDDSCLKKEIFKTEILGNWSIDFAIDDRNSVVEMWRSLGVLTLQPKNSF